MARSCVDRWSRRVDVITMSGWICSSKLCREAGRPLKIRYYAAAYCYDPRSRGVYGVC